MLRDSFRPLIALGVFITITVGVPIARGDDTLGDFEDEIEKRERSGSQGDGRGRRSGPRRTDRDGESEALGALIGSFLSVARTPPERYESRETGTPAAALLRLETTYQRLSSTDVDASTTRGEVIWRFIGVGGEFIRYSEDSPDQELDFSSAEALFRFSPVDALRFTLALGVRRIEGRGSRTGAAGGFSVGLYPLPWLGFEADLRWAEIEDRTLGDYRAGALFRVPSFPYLAVRTGYRGIHYEGETLDGAEIGLVLTW